MYTSYKKVVTITNGDFKMTERLLIKVQYWQGKIAHGGSVNINRIGVISFGMCISNLICYKCNY